MIELIILEHLKSHLNVDVYLETPQPIPPSYILFEKIGSNKTNYLLSSTIAFQSYGKTMFDAATLNDELKKSVEEMVQLEEVSSVNLNSDYNFTDTTTKQYRYQAVFDIYHY